MTFDRYELWNTRTLLTVMEDTDQPPNYWLDLLFPNVITSTDEYIDLEKIPTNGCGYTSVGKCGRPGDLSYTSRVLSV